MVTKFERKSAINRLVYEISRISLRKTRGFGGPTIEWCHTNSTNGLSVSPHVHSVMTSCAQTLYALRVLRAHGLCDSALQTVYRAVVVDKLTYASSARIDFPRQTTAKRSQFLFDAANALASVQVNLTTLVVYVTPLILDYLLRFYIILPCPTSTTYSTSRSLLSVPLL